MTPNIIKPNKVISFSNTSSEYYNSTIQQYRSVPNNGSTYFSSFLSLTEDNNYHYPKYTPAHVYYKQKQITLLGDHQ